MRRGFQFVHADGRVFVTAFRLGALMWQYLGAGAIDDGLAPPHGDG